VGQGFNYRPAFAPDGKTVIWSDFTDTIHVCDTHTGKLVRELKHAGDKGEHIILSPDSRNVGTELTVWDLASGKERYRLQSKGAHFPGAFSPDGKQLAVCKWQEGPEITLFDVATAKEVRRIPLPMRGLDEITFSPDG
jgi:Tol biopolymer transport system component